MLRRLLLPAVLLITAGCGPIEIPRKDVAIFELSAGPGATSCSTASRKISLADSKEFKEAKSYLKRVRVERVTLKVLDPKTRQDAVATRVSGALHVAAADGSGKVTLGEYRDVPLAANASVTVRPSEEASRRLTELLLKAPHEATLLAEGCVDALPAGVKVEATFDYTLTGSLF